MQKPAAGEDAKLIAKGRQLFKDRTCMNCHTVRGHDGAGIVGPDLTHVGARSTIAAGVLENTDDLLRRWLHNPEYFKPGNKMYHGFGGMQGYMGEPKLNDMDKADADVDALVAYLHSLK